MKKKLRIICGLVSIVFMLSGMSAVKAANSAADRLDATVAEWLAENQASSVAVGVIKGGQLVFAKGYGLANRETKMPATPDTVYLLASVSKPVIALAALTLVEAGKLNLDEEVSPYVGFTLRNPHFPQAKITMRHLLTHTAGITDASEADEVTYPRPDPDQSLEATIRQVFLPEGKEYREGAYWSPENAPGMRFEYANYGATLAGFVVEKASGMPFTEYCNHAIFTPLRMNQTRWYNRELPPDAKIAMPYNLDFEPYGIYSFNDYPSGSLHSSVHDFARLLRMLIQGGELDGARVLTAASLKEFERPQFKGEDEGEWMGLFIFSNGASQYGHDGSEAGVSTEFRYDAKGDGAIVLCNADDADTTALMEALLEFAPGANESEDQDRDTSEAAE